MVKEALISRDLPERFARLYDYDTKKFETPLNPQGIADIDGLFELAIRTYPDDLPDFSSAERNKHHVYWSEADWRELELSRPPQQAVIIHEFRNSTPQCAYVPPNIHDWIEKIMIPPPAPPLEIMARRNAAWEAAAILLRSVVLLDKARTEYDAKKDNTRLVYGYVPGLTPMSQRTEEQLIEKTDREYWLSELNGRLDGWRKISAVAEYVPDEDRFITHARLVSVRALKRRIKNGAIVPAVPKDIAA